MCALGECMLACVFKDVRGYGGCGVKERDGKEGECEGKGRGVASGVGKVRE